MIGFGILVCLVLMACYLGVVATMLGAPLGVAIVAGVVLAAAWAAAVIKVSDPRL